MKLVKFSNKRADWILDEISFQDVNLLVGKNATGKSRVIDALNTLVRVILQSSSRTILDANWHIELEHDGVSLSYFVKLKKNNVLEEKIIYNKEEVLIRENGITKIKSIVKNTFDEIDPPIDKIVLHVRRDIKDYPFLETLIQWAESSYGIEFGRITPSWLKNEMNRFDLFSDIESIPEMFNLLPDTQKKNIINAFNSLGYKLEKIDTIEGPHEILYLTIKEKGINTIIREGLLSQGMLRCLYLLIFIEYLASKKTPQLIVIDDLGEGLDYDRVTKLGKVILDVCLSKQIQLIATSNDSFLMDVIDIKYWNVLYRKDSVVKSINMISHPEIFEDFKFTGLSNFDFFSSDYIEQKLKEE